MLASAVPGDSALALDNLSSMPNTTASAQRCVRVQGTRIAAITAAGEPACVRDTIDLHGRYLMPG